MKAGGYADLLVFSNKKHVLEKILLPGHMKSSTKLQGNYKFLVLFTFSVNKETPPHSCQTLSIFKPSMFSKPWRRVLLGQKALCFSYGKSTFLLLADGLPHFVQLYAINVYNRSMLQNQGSFLCSR